MIDRQTIAQIKSTADIYDVVSEFVSLKKVGSNYRGLCPFHNDHSPSFYVSPSRGTCKCFVCGEGGDSVGFIMKHEQLTYPDALRWLANRYGIAIQEEKLSDDQRKEQSDRDAMFIVNEWAADYFHDILLNDIDGRAIGMQYFRQRGVRDDIIERFRLGFCLSDRQAMAKKAVEKGLNPEYLLKTGLCFDRNANDEHTQQRKPSADSLVDRFSGRVMFPWIGVSGRVVAFGGRVLDSRTKGVNQKYVNSPDSVIYHKDHELYGIFQAKRAISKENCVYMVEGYTDVISMHQCGIENVVANSGTALSEHQIKLLHRFTQNIVLLYDGDAAGIKAALRGTDMLLRNGMNVKVMLLPDGDDPDSFAKKHTAEEFRRYIDENKTDFISFKTKVKLEGVTDPRERSLAINSIIESISMIPDTLERTMYIQDCSMRLGLSEQIITAKTNEFIMAYRAAQQRGERSGNSGQQGQNFASTGQQPGQPPVTSSSQADAAASAPQQPVSSAPQQPASSAPSGDTRQYSDDDMPPPDAFLPDDAFSQPSASGSDTPATTTPAAPQPSSQGNAPVQGYGQGRGGAVGYPKKEAVADLLIKMIIKHGGDRIFTAEDEDGSEVLVSVAEFVAADLANDGLMFSLPIYNKVLKEAVDHCYDEDFNSERYFTMHADYDVSDMAIRLTSDSVYLAQSMQVKETEDSLRSKVKHLILDFRQEFIFAKLKQLQQDIANSESEPERQMALMAEYSEVQKLRALIAKNIGSSITPV